MKTLSLVAIHRLFALASMSVFLLFLIAAGLIGFSFGDLLTGNIKSREQTDLLTRFNIMRFETAVKRLELRRALPDPDPSLPDPFQIMQ